MDRRVARLCRRYRRNRIGTKIAAKHIAKANLAASSA